jgi:hypothetical protein
MIRFVNNKDKAIIINDVGSEDGWVVEYNPKNHKFLVWDNAERHVEGERYATEFDTLEAVLRAVNSYT